MVNKRKPPTQVFRFRLTESTLEKVQKIAAREDRTAAYIIREFIEDGVERRAEEGRAK